MSRAGAKFISGGTNLLDLMKLEIEQPTHLVDISRLPLEGDRRSARTAGCGSAPRRRNSDVAADRRVRSALSGPLRRRCSPAPPASCATRHPSAAICCSAHAARTSTTPQRACNKRDPGIGLRGDRRLQPHPRDPRRKRRLHRHAPFGHGGRDVGAGRRDRTAGAEQSTRRVAIGDFYCLPGNTPHIETVLGRAK